MGNRVERVRTPISETQMAQAVIESWKQLFGSTPSKQQVGLVMAQNSLETGHRNSMWNYNIGNLTTDGKGSYDFYDDLTTKEQIHPGDWQPRNLKYRSYSSLIDGVKDYLRLLSGKHYSKAWDNILNPNPVAFSKALKESGYYTANEAPYTKSIVQLYSQFGNSDSYEKARAGRIEPAPVSKDDFFGKYLARFKDNGMNIYDQLGGKSSTPTNDTTNLSSVLDNYLQMIAASEKSNKKLYKKFLPTNHILIEVQASNYTYAVEFANILCMALDEELTADSFVHTNGKKIEVECTISGPSSDCFKAASQLTNVLADTFKYATAKVGGILIKNNLIANKKSSYQQISLTAAEIQHRKFLLKFI